MQHRLIALALAAAFLAPLQTRAQATVEQPWARATAAGQSAGGGYLRLHGGAAGDRLLSAGTAVSGRVELHSMTMDGDIMRMREVPFIDVPAGQTVELGPGGLHLMFLGLAAPLKDGSSFALTLRFARAGEVKVDMPVMSRPPAGAQGKPMAMPGHKH